MTSLIDNEELDRRIAADESEVSDLTLKLSIATNRLRNLRNIKDAALALENEIEFDTAASQVGSSSVIRSETTGRITDVMNPDGTLAFTIPPPDKKRIRSTEMVADMINESHRAWTREEAHEGFKDTYGYPESWGNPANAINNALGRAAANGLIVELNGLYMSRTIAEIQQNLEETGEA